MKNTMKLVGIIAAGFYATFVLQNLWNWFVAAALSGNTIGYWQAYGITLVITVIVTDRSNRRDDDQRWEKALALLNVCIPYDRRSEVDQLIKKNAEDEWKNMGAYSLVEMGGYTLALVIGWGIHTFLM